MELSYYHEMLEKHIDLVNRRLLEGEKIPTSEKLYSIFERHTEWLSKGKSGKPVELGHNFLIATDQYHFIVYHKVVEGVKDVNLTIELADALINKFPNQINSLSLDKGFYSKANKEALSTKIPLLVMPKKGKRNKEEQERESDKAFKASRRQHSAVESAINALEVHGLDKCPDHGVDGFERYVALAVISRNIQKLGAEIRKQEREAERKRRRKKQNLAA
jgi:hypothetical protein